MAWLQRLTFNSSTSSFTSDYSDIVIMVMGPTGAGKSTFIRKYTGNESVVIGSTTESCTAKVTPYVARIPDKYAAKLAGRRLILVDTPGFDDTHSSDAKILGKVANWLAQCYKGRTPIAGIIYVHDITLTRMYGSSKANLKLFSKLCGKGSFNKVVIVTTHWQDVTNRCDLETREKEMKQKWWKDFLKGGAHVMRVESNTRETGTAIIERLLEGFIGREQEAQEGLQIQKEMVDWSRSIPETKAGRELKYTLEDVKKILEKEMASDLDEEEQEKLRENLDKAREQIKMLKLSLGGRLKVLFGF